MNYTFFGVQVLVQAVHGDPLRGKLHDLIANASAEQTLVEKRRFWKALVATLNDAKPTFQRGYWDLIRGSKAEATFETWSSELEAPMVTEPEDAGAAAEQVIGPSVDERHILLTFMVLVGADTNTDRTLGERCDLPEESWWTRRTFMGLLRTFAVLNFVNVRADAVYLSPGNDHAGLSGEDLRDGGYEHLRPLG